jgi:hypothetical protein
MNCGTLICRERQKSTHHSNGTGASSSALSSSLDYHHWFEPAMYHWIRIAEFKARARTARAVELDSWSRMDDRVYHSMSAVNTTDIFNNVREFLHVVFY